MSMLISKKKTADREIYLLYQPPHRSHTMPSLMRFSGSAKNASFSFGVFRRFQIFILNRICFKFLYEIIQPHEIIQPLILCHFLSSHDGLHSVPVRAKPTSTGRRLCALLSTAPTGQAVMQFPQCRQCSCSIT